MQRVSHWLLPLAAISGCQREQSSGEIPDVSGWDEPWSAATPSLPPPAPCPVAAAAMIRGVPYPDLQSALDASQPYDVVKVCPGTWIGNFLMPTHGGPLEVRGLTGDPRDVVLEGGGSGIVLDDTLPGSWRVRGITFRDASRLLTLSYPPTRRVELLDCVFNAPTLELGASIDADFVTIARTTFEGIPDDALNVALESPTGTLLLDDVTFQANGTPTDGVAHIGLGGGRVAGSAHTIVLRDLHFYDNISGGGGVLQIDDGWTTQILLQDSEFIGNENIGSAVVKVSPDINDPTDRFRMFIDRTLFEDNRGGDGIALGLESYAWAAPFQSPTQGVHFGIRDTSFRRNVSNGTESDPENVAALFYAFDTILHLFNVDFGAGVDTNERDILGCDQDYGAGISAVLDANRYVCP